jgi:catechol 2,3-dioxygenase-like lactoylglutathione lyase family enzyme
VAVTHLLIARDVERSRRFYVDVLGAKTLMEGPPSILRFYNTRLVLATEGGPTDDKPGVVAAAPLDARTLTSALNLRVADIYEVYTRWRARGAEFLTVKGQTAPAFKREMNGPHPCRLPADQTE